MKLLLIKMRKAVSRASIRLHNVLGRVKLKNRRELVRGAHRKFAALSLTNLGEAGSVLQHVEHELSTFEAFAEGHSSLPRVLRVQAALAKRAEVRANLRGLESEKSFTAIHTPQVETAKYWLHVLDELVDRDLKVFSTLIDAQAALVHEFEKSGMAKVEARTAALTFFKEHRADQTDFLNLMKSPPAEIAKMAAGLIEQYESEIVGIGNGQKLTPKDMVDVAGYLGRISHLREVVGKK